MRKSPYTRMMHNLSNSNSRLILILTLCIFVIITTVGTVSFYSTKAILQREISEPQNHLLRLGMDSINGMIKDTDQVAIQIAVNSNTFAFLNKGSGDVQYKTISDLIAYIDNLSVSPAISSIYLYSIQRDSIVASSPYGYSSHRSNFPDLEWLKSLDVLKTKPFYIEKRKMANGQEGITMYRGVTVNNELAGVIAVNMKWDFFFSKIYPDYVAQSGGTRIIYDQNNELIYILHDSDFPIAAFSQSLDQGKRDDISEFSDHGQKYVITQVVSDLSGWKFVSAIPVKTLLARISSVRNIVFAISVFAIAIGTLSIYYFNYMAFKPVRRIKRLISSDDKTARSTDLNELELLLTKLVKDHESLSLHFNQSKPELRSKFVQDLAAGRLGELEIRDKWDQYFDSWDDSPLHVMMVSIDRYNEWADPLPEGDRVLLKYAMGNIVEELLGNRMRVALVDYSRENVLVLGQSKEQPFLAEDLKADVQEAIRTIQSLLMISVSVGVKSGVKGTSRIQLHLKEAAAALSYRLYEGYGRAIFYSEAMEEDTFKALDERWKSDLLSCVETGHMEEAEQLLQRLVSDAVQQRINPDNALSYFDDIVFALSREAGELGWEKSNILDNHTEYSFATLQINDIRSILAEAVAFMAEQYKWRQPKKEYAVVHRMIAFMNERLHDNIGVTEIAQSVGLSTSSASQMFKQEMNMTVYDYLTRLRIQKAEELLVTTDERIVDIAYQVGYLNENSFIRSFRKAKEITPGKYREMRKKA